MSLLGRFWRALTDVIAQKGLKGIVQIPLGTGYTKMEPKTYNVFTLERMTFTDKSTIGELRIDGDLLCFTLEDTSRAQGVKIDHKTAIPAGKYEIIITESSRFKRPLPLLLGVPNFENIRIHPGNTADDTSGCILPGMRAGINIVYDSRKAFDLLFPEIQKRLKMGKLFIAIVGGFHLAVHDVT